MMLHWKPPSQAALSAADVFKEFAASRAERCRAGTLIGGLIGTLVGELCFGLKEWRVVTRVADTDVAHACAGL
jgi:hypothetical protein